MRLCAGYCRFTFAATDSLNDEGWNPAFYAARRNCLDGADIFICSESASFHAH